MALKDDLYKEFCTVFIKFYFDEIHNILTSSQIIKCANYYEKLLSQLCIKFASNLKAVVEEDYGAKILGKSYIALSSIFDFRLDKALHRILVLKTQKIITADSLRIIKSTINSKYIASKDTLTSEKKKIFKEIFSFINEYINFSKYITKESQKFSSIKLKNSSMKLEPRSLLIENLRYIFPRSFKLPIYDYLLSWYLFGDEPRDRNGKRIPTKISRFIAEPELFRRPDLNHLLDIDFRVSKLSLFDFKKNYIIISEDQLLKLKQNVKYIIFDFLFSNPYDTKYVKEETSKGIPVGTNYFIPEYFVIRAIYFALLETNTLKNLSFNYIQNQFSINTRLTDYLATGCGFGHKNLRKLKEEIKTLLKKIPQGSNIQIIKDALHELDKYYKIYIERQERLASLLGFASFFQQQVHEFMEDTFNVKFISEKNVKDAVGNIDFIEFNSNDKEKEREINPLQRFDGYFKLTDSFRNLFGLDDKWVAIAFEAQGSWHNDLEQFLARYPDKTKTDFKYYQNLDQLKRDICRVKNIILIEIDEDLPKSKWINEVIKQIEEQTGITPEIH